MIAISVQQKSAWTEMFSDVTALYQVFNEGRETYRTKQAVYRCDEVPAIPLDFMIDVELKAKRVLPGPLYDMFLRLSVLGELSLLPEGAKLLLGKVWTEYGLGIDGTYAKLYFTTKNDQMRSWMKGENERDTSYGEQIVGNWESDPFRPGHFTLDTPEITGEIDA